MDILEDLAGYEGRPGIKTCVISRLRESDPALAAQWDRAFASSYQHAAIGRWFADRGHPEINGEAVAKHRRKECVVCRTS